MGLFSRKEKKDKARGPAWAGRAIRTSAPADPEHAAEIADDFAAVLQEHNEVTLDYSVESLRSVDQLLSSMELEGSDAVAEYLMPIGFYVGEVLVRTHGYTWVALDDKVTNMFGFNIAVKSPTGSYLNVIGKAFGRVENGPEDSVEFLVRAEIASESRRQE